LWQRSSGPAAVTNEGTAAAACAAPHAQMYRQRYRPATRHVEAGDMEPDPKQ